MVSLPELPEPLPHRIEGLSIIKSHPCPNCSSTGSTYESLKAHMRKLHKGFAYPEESSFIRVHPLSHGSHKQFIRLQEEQDVGGSASSPSDILSQASKILKAASALPTEAPGDDPREYCPWLRRVRWHDLVSGKEIRELISLVKFPSDVEYPHLSDGLERLLYSASQMFETTSELILQKLNTRGLEDG